jgi:hypothetical protein
MRGTYRPGLAHPLQAIMRMRILHCVSAPSYMALASGVATFKEFGSKPGNRAFLHDVVC